jgi:hypothetical protein
MSGIPQVRAGRVLPNEEETYETIEVGAARP